MSNYNTQLQSNNTDLQTVLQTLQNKAAGGEQATPVISVNSSTGLITATAGTKSSTHQLAFQAAKTITPSATSQVAVSSGYYTGGNITIAGDANLVAENIKSGVDIFGVIGTLEEGGGGSEDGYDEADSLIKMTMDSYTNNRVFSIGQGAFAYAENLTTVNFPVATTIGNNAFRYCYKLTTASFPVATNIGDSAFAYCSSLTTANFPAATTIRSYAFAYCSNLTTASFPVATTIGSYTFRNCFSLTAVSFPVATTINNDAFAYCSSLTTISFPVATAIGSYAFAGCSNLTTVSFPVATTIGDNTFAGCSKLTTVSFPVATTIGGNAFAGCSSLTTISFPVATTIGKSAFAYCSKLTTISFPVVTTIGNSAFAYCSSLTTISFPVVTTISSGAFYCCPSLTTASFPVATTIGSYAFFYCSKLTTVSFPVATTISSGAFQRCSSLTSLYLTGSSIPTLSHINAFQLTPMSLSTYTGSFGSIFVPASLVASYKTATNWATYADRITAIPTITVTIDGIEYQAIDGMTWGEWINSEYNTDGYYLDDEDYVYNGEKWLWRSLLNDGAGSTCAERSDWSIDPTLIYEWDEIASYGWE